MSTVQHTNQQSLERQLLQQMFSALRALQDSDPEYCADLEEADVDSAPRQVILDLIDRAPTEQVRFYLFGKFTMREYFSSVTGRAFE